MRISCHSSSRTRSLSHQLNNSLTHSLQIFIHSFLMSLIYSSIHSVTYPSINPFTHTHRYSSYVLIVLLHMHRQTCWRHGFCRGCWVLHNVCMCIGCICFLRRCFGVSQMFRVDFMSFKIQFLPDPTMRQARNRRLVTLFTCVKKYWLIYYEAYDFNYFHFLPLSSARPAPLNRAPPWAAQARFSWDLASSQ